MRKERLGSLSSKLLMAIYFICFSGYWFYNRTSQFSVGVRKRQKDPCRSSGRTINNTYYNLKASLSSFYKYIWEQINNV